VIVQVRNRIEVADSYRLNRTQSLFNVESEMGREFNLDADLPTEDGDWRVGIVVGPSGSGKSSIGRELAASGWKAWSGLRWPKDRAIVDAVGKDRSFDEVTGALASVGLGTVPSWLRPFHVLSGGEQFRAEMARLLLERPTRVVVDEFTSVVDRQVAQIGAMAFVKAWRRGAGQAILLTCHYDVLEWIQPDWIFDTRTGRLSKESLHPAQDQPGDRRDRLAVLEI
jgi:ABC-type lipoprotein export system ATPase subunit